MNDHDFDPAPRLLTPNRAQVALVPTDLDSLLPRDHVARSVWAFVARVDLKSLYASIKSVEGNAGRPAIDPAILVSLWLLATLDGVGSARALARLTEDHVAYRWVCGGVSVNYHTLSDFRVGNEAFLDKLLATSVTTLVAAGAASLESIAQDGRRTRAHASSPSFRSRKSLERLKADVEERIGQLKRELGEDPAATSRRQAAARQRAERERLARIEAALQQMPQAEATKERNHRKKRRKGGAQVTVVAPEPAEGGERGGGSSPEGGDTPSRGTAPPPPPEGSTEASPTDRTDEARVSTTDPECRVMKMADRGFRPAYNVQAATTVKGGVVVAIDVSAEGSDTNLLEPMIARIEATHGATIEHAIVDGGYVNLSAIEKLATRERPCLVYAPPPKPKGARRTRYEAVKGDSPAIARWRARMGTPEGAALYAQRSSAAEWVNAGFANRGFNRFNVRGRDKARSVALWHGIAHNFQRMRAAGLA